MTDVEQIKQKIDIVAFISEYVALKKTGANFKGLCPFHAEKTPSFIVSPERQIWHCFGGCNEGGDVFKFLMKIENLEFAEALKILARRAGVTLSGGFAQSRTAELKEKIYEVNHLASEFYQYILTKHPMGEKALDYLKDRKITDSSVKLFGIGYAPQSWDSLSKFLHKKGYAQELMQSAGLISKSGIGNTFDRFRGRLMFTLRDHRGNVVGFAGRLLDPNAKEAKYVNTAETPAYVKGDLLYGLDLTKEEIKKEGFGVVVEGEIDCIQSYQAEVRNVVAIKGSALTEEQVALLKRYTENVYLSLDADFAGDAAAHRGIETADWAGLNIKVVTFTDAKDPDELIKKDPGLWHRAVKNAVSFYDYVIDIALEKHDKNTAEGAKKIVSEVAKFIEPIENLVVKEHYVRKLAMKLGVNQENLEAQLAKELKKMILPRQTESIAPNTPQSAVLLKTRAVLLEEYLVSLLLQCPNPADYLLLTSIRLRAEDFASPALAKIYLLLASLVDNPKSDVSLPGNRFDINILARFIPSELTDLFNKLYLLENKINLDDQAEVLEEIQKTVWEIKELSLREKLKMISGQIKKGEESPALEEEFTLTTAALQKLLEQKALVRHSQA